MIINRVSDTDSSKYLDDKGLAELVTQIKTYADTHSGGSVTVETLKQATIDVSDYNTANKPIVDPTSPNNAMAQVEITLSNIPVPTDVESTKDATIDVSTYDPLNKPVITPTYPKEAMARVEVSLSNVPSIEANKQVSIDVHQYDPSNKPIITPTYPNDAVAEVEVDLYNIPTIERSKQATVDVSTYDSTDKPVITPTTGNDGMGEVVVTLDNIPVLEATRSYSQSGRTIGVDLVDIITPSSASYAAMKKTEVKYKGMSFKLCTWAITDTGYAGTKYLITTNGTTAPFNITEFKGWKLLKSGAHDNLSGLYSDVYFGQASGVQTVSVNTIVNSNWTNMSNFTRASASQFTFKYYNTATGTTNTCTVTKSSDIALTTATGY